MTSNNVWFCHAMLCKRGLPSCGVRPSVRPSVTFVDYVKSSNHIFEFFSPSGSRSILVFCTKRRDNIPTNPPPLTGSSNAGGVGRNCDSEPISGFIARCQCCDRQVLSTWCRRVCWWRETTTKCLWQEVSTLHQRQQNSIYVIVRSDKSVAYVTNNKRLRSTFCTIEANYWQTRSIARPLCDSRATCSYARRLTEPEFSVVNSHGSWPGIKWFVI